MNRTLQTIDKKILSCITPWLVLMALFINICYAKGANAQEKYHSERYSSRTLEKMSYNILAKKQIPQSRKYLGKRISVNLKNISLEKALKKVAEESGLKLSYGDFLFTSNIKIKLKAVNETVNTVLWEILKDTNLRYAISENGHLVFIRSNSKKVGDFLQTGTIQGVVTDAATGETLPGVNVYIDGTQKGSTTDLEGTYEITNISAGTQILIASFIGYQRNNKEVQVIDGDTMIVNFALKLSNQRLSEIVVTGTGGEVSREKLGTAISSINPDELLERTPISSINQLFEGRVSGLRSVQTTGAIGGGKDLRVRGTSSFTLGQRPAVYVDGIRVDTRAAEWAGGGFSGGQGTDRLSDLSPNEIERVEIVKGAAAATLYGSDAANGVIQIITKNGQFNTSPQWRLRSSVGVNRHRPNFPTKLFPNFTGANGFRAEDVNETLIQTGIQNNNSLSVEGGGSDFAYFLSSSFTTEQGSIQPNWMKRGNLRSNLQWRVDDAWNISVTTGYSRSRILEVQAGNNWNALLGNAILGNPRVATPDRPYGEPWTSVAAIQEIQAYTDVDRITSGVTVRYNPINNFRQRLVLGLDAVSEQRERLLPYSMPYVGVPAGERNLFHRRFRSWTFDYLGNYEFSITENIRNELSWGGQGFMENARMVFATGSNYAGPGVTTVGGGAQTQGDEEFTEVVSVGIFGQTRFSFLNKLFATFGLRVDGNSAFGTNYGLQKYPKGEMAYLLSEEGFIPNAFSSLKLRAAVGMSGMSPGAFDQFRTFSPLSVLGDQAGVIPAAPGNPELEPEKSIEFETGIEGGLFQDRIFFDFTYYRQRTKDALVPVALPPSEGFAQAQLRNIGEIENIGWEVALDIIPIQTADFSWNTNLKMSGNQNEVIDMGEVSRFEVGSGGTGAGTGWVEEGYPIAGVWAYEPISYDAETQSWERTDEMRYQGPMYPTFSGSISNSFTYKNFSFSFVLASELGAFFTNGTRQYQFNFRTGDEYFSTLDENQNPTPESERLYSYFRTFTSIDSRDHIKIQEVSFSYNLPANITEKLGLGRTTFSLTGQELYWWDKSNAPHPQVNYRGGANFTQGSAFLTVPPTRRISFAISTRF